MASRTLNAHTVLPYAGWAVGVYTRASDDARKTRTSVSDQKTGGLKWIRENKASHYRTYCDNDLSASRFATKQRDDFHELLDDVAAGRLRMIWFWKLSRSQRQLGVFAQLRDLCRRKGVLWIVENRVYDLSDRGDRIALGIQALMDEDLPDQISDNVRAAFASNAEKGRPHGFTAYGWRRVYDDSNGQLVAQVIRDDQAAAVQDAARRVVSGESLYSIAEHLNNAGYQPPRGIRWRRENIPALLRRPANIGKRTYHGVIIGDGIWPPILDDVTYYEVRRILDDPSRAIQHPTAVKHLLSGIALCGKCGSQVRAYPRDGRLKYQCETPAKCVAIRADWLDDYIEDKVWDRLSRPDAIEWLSRPSQAAVVVAAADEAQSLTERLDEWYRAAARGEVTPLGLKTIEQQLLKDIEDARARAAVQQVSPVLREAARADIADVWPDWELPRRRAVIRELLEIQVMPVGRGRGRVFEVSRVPTRWLHELPTEEG